jgi:hypothetical protein
VCQLNDERGRTYGNSAVTDDLAFAVITGNYGLCGFRTDIEMHKYNHSTTKSVQELAGRFDLEITGAFLPLAHFEGAEHNMQPVVSFYLEPWLRIRGVGSEAHACAPMSDPGCFSVFRFGPPSRSAAAKLVATPGHFPPEKSPHQQHKGEGRRCCSSTRN